MSFVIHGLRITHGVAIGRAVVIKSSRVNVTHYFIKPHQIEREVNRLRMARDALTQELTQLRQSLEAEASLKASKAQTTTQELAALLEVHLMLLSDEALTDGVRQWVAERLYNAEWALTAQLETVSQVFDEMEESYLRERKADLEQIVEGMLKHLRQQVAGTSIDPFALSNVLSHETQSSPTPTPLILIAHDLSPGDLLQLKNSVFAGFVTDVGGKTSHTAIVARSMDIPAVLGAKEASHLITQDDWVVIDANAGVAVVDPSAFILQQYEQLKTVNSQNKERLFRLKNTPAITRDRQPIELFANIEQPSDVSAALRSGAVGIGLFRTEFLFMGRGGDLPDEEEQYLAYRQVVQGMQGMPVTIRTIDVGADKPLDRTHRQQEDRGHPNPALGLRAIRWSLADPSMFLTQLRAILRSAAHGKVLLLLPMISNLSEITQSIALIEQARQQLDARGVVSGPIKLGAMIEIPASALCVAQFLKYFEFISIGTNDLIQYTLAVDRADESVAHLYNPLHPAILQLIQHTIQVCREQGKAVSLCGEMAGDPTLTRLLIGMGLRSLSMLPTQLLAVKQQILRCEVHQLEQWTKTVLLADDPAALIMA